MYDSMLTNTHLNIEVIDNNSNLKLCSFDDTCKFESTGWIESILLCGIIQNGRSNFVHDYLSANEINFMLISKVENGSHLPCSPSNRMQLRQCAIVHIARGRKYVSQYERGDSQLDYLKMTWTSERI